MTAEDELSPTETIIGTPPSSSNDPIELVAEGPITSTMIEEEQKLMEESEKADKENIEKLKEKAATEFTATVNKQRFQRLNFLIEKSTLYANFLAQKMQREQEASRNKAAAESKKEVKAKDAETVTPVAATRVSSRRGAGNPVTEAPSKKRAVASKKRKANDDEYNITDYVDADKIKKHKAEDDASTVKDEQEAEEEEALTKPTRSARQPELVTGGLLRDYQLAGLEWMVSLYENGLNGILADEMGLGKTLQTISFLAYLRSKGVWGPFLIVAPLSTLANWVNEFERFTPTVPVVLYHGTPDERAEIRKNRLRKLDAKFPIIVTSYELVMNDRKFLQFYSWKYIVVDEGHRLKNLNCKLIRELKSYHSANRLLLTGTPLQNNLSELWSLLNFLLPDIFDDLDSFQEWFDFSGINEAEGQERILGQESSEGIVSNLHKILKPFLLRRLKTDVEHSLPKKKEYLLYAPLTPLQKEYYQASLGRDIRSFLIQQKSGHVDDVEDEKAAKQEESEEDDEGKGPTAGRRSQVRKLRTSTRVAKEGKYKSEELSDDEYFESLEQATSTLVKDEPSAYKTTSARQIDIKRATKSVNNMKLMNVVMQLRKICNHPFLFEWPIDPKTLQPVVSDDLLSSSGKMLILNRLLPALFERGHKVLIFSQFTTMLDIIQDWAEYQHKWTCCRIDGGVKQVDRRSQIADFNSNPELKLFLLSTRAGGLGINLTSADTVIIFDSDWNPQMDLQAQDRVHRIGQTRPVMIYRLVTANTVEGKIIEKASMKRKLEKLVIQKGKFKHANGGDVKTDKESTISELAAMLASEDGEKFLVATKDDVVLTDKHLNKLLDRSEAAYDTTLAAVLEDEVDEGLALFKQVKQNREDQNDVLATKASASASV